jgi:hypothetical protein
MTRRRARRERVADNAARREARRRERSAGNAARRAARWRKRLTLVSLEDVLRMLLTTERFLLSEGRGVRV